MVNKEGPLIIIPAVNEQNEIGSVINKIKEKMPDAHILVVDDGSTDDTPQIAKVCGAKVLSHAFNLGYGAALQTGYKYATLKGYRYIIQMDGDGQHYPEHAQKLLDTLIQSKGDVVIGSRFIEKNSYKEAILRRIGRTIFSNLVTTITGNRATDPTSGFRAMNERAIRFCTGANYPTDYPDADMLIVFHKAGLKVVEVAVIMCQGGEDNVSMHKGFSIVYYCFKMCLSIFLTLLRKPEA